jgi:carbonic anhydrase
MIEAKTDQYSKLYTNLQKSGNIDVNLEWKSAATNIPVRPLTTETQQFNSRWAGNTIRNQRFQAAQFHWHSQSEHTIDGQRFDLEMHTVHFPEDNGEVIAAAVGIIFDTKNYDQSISVEDTALIDRFFEGITVEERGKNNQGVKNTKTKVDEVTYGDLMLMVDNNNRWTYRGSVTTPPCATLVYWNVMRQVYPIKEAQLEKFKKMLK